MTPISRSEKAQLTRQIRKQFSKTLAEKILANMRRESYAYWEFSSARERFKLRVVSKDTLLIGCFSWLNSKEGFDYWNNLHKDIS